MRSNTLLCLILTAGIANAAETPAEKATQVLQKHCHRCHGQDGVIEGGMNYILDFDRLIARKKIVAGKPDDSPIYKRMNAGSMPPAGEPKPSREEIAIIKQWIESGAKPIKPVEVHKTVSTAEVQSLILKDLEAIDRRSRRFTRYFTITHLANAGLNEDELQTYRNALSKLLNSLSWHPKLHAPEPIDAGRTVYRIDLRWYMWDATLWNRILNDYPYGVLDDTASARAIIVGTATKMPVLRADWFVGVASRAPLYYDLLQSPGNLGELEKQLRIDAPVNILQERVIRVGFNGSGIARFNRILERHDSVHGAYWRSYDFEEPTQNLTDRLGTQPGDRRNVFAFPLGPGLVENTFTHSAGEAIYALPNGLHAYFLVNAINGRVDKGVQALVSDPKRPDKAVEAGVSCMSCHVSGILPKADQVRLHVEKNNKAFSKTELELVNALYPLSEKSLKAMEDDGKAYAAALAKLGIRVSRSEVVSTITLKYEADLDLVAAACEVGLSPEEFRKQIDLHPTLRQSLGNLRVSGGTISRQIFFAMFGELVRTLKLGTLFQGNVNGAQLADNTGELDPLEAQGNVANAVTFSNDGKRAYVASPDRSIRIWDVEGKRDFKRLVGHTTTVWSIALNALNTRAISGGMDGTVRIWDLATGEELKKLPGHISLVSAVGFSPDGQYAISGGYDGTIVIWHTETGKELFRLENKAKYIHALAVHPTKPRVAIAGDQNVLIVDYTTGEVVKKWTAHDAAISSIAYGDDGKTLVTGGDDRVIKLWNVNGWKLATELTGHEGSIRGLSLKQGGKLLVSSASDNSVKLWDITTKKDVATFKQHASAVVNVTFLPSGIRTLSMDRDLVTKIWDVTKWVEK